MKFDKAIVVVFVTLTSSIVAAQSPFSDVRGNTSLLLNEKGGFAQLKFGEESASFGYRHDLTNYTFLNFDFNVGFDGDQGSIFEGDQLSPNTRFGVTYATNILTNGAEKERLRTLRTAANTARNNDKAVVDRIGKEIKDLESENDLVKKTLDDLHKGFEESVRLEERKRRLNDTQNRNLRKIHQLQQQLVPAKEKLEFSQKVYDLNEKLFLATGRGFAYTAGVRVGGQAASYKLYDHSADFDNAFTDKSFEGYGGTLFLNGYGPYSTFGVSIGWERGNNISDLSLVKVTDTTSVVGPDGVTRTTQRSRSGYRGSYKIVDSNPLRVDYLHRPPGFQDRIGLSLFGRVDLADKHSNFVPGVGVFILQKGAPRGIVGGVVVQFENGRANAAVVAGTSF